MFLCGCKTAARVACEFGVKSAWSICRRAFVSFIKARMAETSLGPSPMLGDPDLITRLVANLVDNAVRHDVPGGAVEVSTAQRDGQAVLIVANSGPVIPPGEIGRLMQPFQRLATARSSDADGHGLGLPIVRAIATAHGATLTTRARPGGGMNVQVSFPACGAAITQREPQTAEASTGIMGL